MGSWKKNYAYLWCQENCDLKLLELLLFDQSEPFDNSIGPFGILLKLFRLLLSRTWLDNSLRQWESTSSFRPIAFHSVNQKVNLKINDFIRGKTLERVGVPISEVSELHVIGSDNVTTLCVGWLCVGWLFLGIKYFHNPKAITVNNRRTAVITNEINVLLHPRFEHVGDFFFCVTCVWFAE